jgi:hypothetical protein
MSPIKVNSKYVLSTSNLKSVLQPEGSIFYASEEDRFRTDFAAEDREKREAAYRRRQAAHDLNRSVRDAQAYQRSMSIEAVEKQKAERFNRRADAMKEKERPDFKSAFNPITHEYDVTSKGKVLETHDRLTAIRQQRRMRNIDSKGSSSYNLIDGSDRRVY